MSGGELLEIIRVAELESAQAVDDARAAGEERVAAAREQARRIGAEAHRRAEAAGERIAVTILADARAEAEEIARRGGDLVAGLRGSVGPRLGPLVDDMVELVLAPPADEGA